MKECMAAAGAAAVVAAAVGAADDGAAAVGAEPQVQCITDTQATHTKPQGHRES